MNIYFICTGNTCRSPMAEALLRAEQIEGISVKSAGIHAADGYPISQNAQTLLEEMDMPFTAFSNSLTKQDIEWADHVLTMTKAHKEALLMQFPEADSKTFTLKEFAGAGEGDVTDPFGGNLITYRETFNELQQLIGMVKRKVMGDE